MGELGLAVQFELAVSSAESGAHPYVTSVVVFPLPVESFAIGRWLNVGGVTVAEPLHVVAITPVASVMLCIAAVYRTDTHMVRV